MIIMKLIYSKFNLKLLWKGHRKARYSKRTCDPVALHVVFVRFCHTVNAPHVWNSRAFWVCAPWDWSVGGLCARKWAVTTLTGRLWYQGGDRWRTLTGLAHLLAVVKPPSQALIPLHALYTFTVIISFLLHPQGLHCAFVGSFFVHTVHKHNCLKLFEMIS